MENNGNIEVIGFTAGTFKDDRGEQREYASIFVAEPFAGQPDETRSFTGRKAAKYAVANKTLLSGLEIGAKVNLFFDAKGKVVLVQQVQGPAKKG